MPVISDFVAVTNLLNQLDALIKAAERGTSLQVTAAGLNLHVVHNKKVGIGTPEMSAFFIPKNLIGGDITEGRTQRLSFTLKRSRAAASTTQALVAGLEEALTTLEVGLRTLANLDQRFENTAQIDFQFDLTHEGKIDFVLRAGGTHTQTHTLSLTVQITSQA